MSRENYISKEQWIALYGAQEIERQNLVVVPCRCADPACKGWQVVYPGHLPYLPTELDLPSITCPICGRTSYNRNDVAQRYCGYCHRFL